MIDITKQVEKMMQDLASSIPTVESSYKKASENPNRISAWYPRIKDLFLTPETAIVDITLDEFRWLRSDDYKDEDIQSFGDALLTRLDEQNFNIDRKLFIKTGNFSNKFVFESCCVTDPKRIGFHALDVFYGSMLCSCPATTEFAIREFIDSSVSDRGTIYSGMPLNTEFRLFYDFDTNELVTTCNYWDTKTMLSSSAIKSDERETLKQTLPEIEADFAKLVPELEAEVLPKLAQVEGLSGMWSVDFMHNGEDFWLIDMALAQHSYFYEKALKAKEGDKANG